MPTEHETVESDTGDRQRLALAVKDRRQQLGLSVRAAADNGDVARGTWTALEDGTRRTSDNNYAGIERALHWAPGSIAVILSGGTAVIAEPPAEAQVNPRSGTLVGGSAPERDEALIRVMRSDLDDDVKARLMEMLVNEKRDAERLRLERSQQLINLFGEQN